jgi:hypothetical protein
MLVSFCMTLKASPMRTAFNGMKLMNQGRLGVPFEERSVAYLPGHTSLSHPGIFLNGCFQLLEVADTLPNMVGLVAIAARKCF